MTRSQPIDPAKSPWTLLGAALRHWREDVAGLKLRPAAARAYVDFSHLAKWERGERPPPPEAIAILDQVFGAGGVLIALHKLVEAFEREPQGTTQRPHRVDAEGMHVERRQILQSFAAIAAVGALPIDAVERVRHTMAQTVGGVRVSDWEETAFEYAHMLLRDPPALVLPDLIRDAHGLQQVILGGPPGEAAHWARVNAQMAFLVAQGLGYLGEVREARHWWRAAQHAAELADDSGLQAAVLGYEAAQAQYAGRPDVIVLRRAQAAIAAARGRACPGAAEAYGVMAMAAAQAGNSQAALTGLDTLGRVVEQLPDEVTADDATAFGWPAARMLHTRSFVLSRVGDPSAAETAAAEAIAAYPPWKVRPIAQVQLHRAATAVRLGDLEGGLGHAGAVLDRLDPAHHTMFVRGAAARVLEAVPAVEAAHTPAVEEYRERLALPPARPTTEA
ncbi:helix-turn-helix transcriptional regulator [Microbispora sp. CSR-4]|uniref:helix-turn-helix domain-containing protein n=1 Tax=Microbispora sp. CSR-4 TaxID=2592813 RepID=UPI0011C7AB33|nr:helix-turn-helix transcriptional regulator [Microbispora sp. CSR-4]